MGAPAITWETGLIIHGYIYWTRILGSYSYDGCRVGLVVLRGSTDNTAVFASKKRGERLIRAEEMT